jgi:iron complex transport system substrate-binding protein
MMLSLAACGQEAPVQTESSDTARPFTDDIGRTVEIPEEITRVAVSGPLAQIMLYALAPETMVGLAVKWYDSAEGIIPQEYLELPYLGQIYNSADLNVEELALTEPQLILDVGQELSASAEELDGLQERTNIPAVYVACSLETMPQTFRKLGELLGREEQAEELAAYCERVYTRMVSIMDAVGENKVSALYIMGEEGLHVLARDSYHSELLNMLTENLAAVENPSGKGSGNEVTMEQIALWDPEFILFGPDSIYAEAAELPVWAELDAIGRGNYVEVPQGPHNWMGTPPSVQRCLGMLWLTARLYPTYCDYDVKAEVLEYYELFYHCTLSDAQYEQLTKNAF